MKKVTAKTEKDPIATPKTKTLAKVTLKGAKMVAPCTDKKMQKFQKKLDKLVADATTDAIKFSHECGVCPTCAAPVIQKAFIHAGCAVVVGLLEYVTLQYGKVLDAQSK